MTAIAIQPHALSATPAPALRRCRSESALHTARAADTLVAQPLTLKDKRQVFVDLLHHSQDYRRVMLPSWVHTLGNGVLGGCFVGLLANIGGFSPAQSFMAYALVESTQMLFFGVLNVYGAHRRDQARPRDGVFAAKQRFLCQRDMQRLCVLDALLGASLGGVALALHTGTGAILPVLLATRLITTCKNSYEMNLFTCLRQLGRNPVDVARGASAGQALLAMETLVHTACYHFAALAVQYMFLSAAATSFVPLTVGAILVGTCVTLVPKAMLAVHTL